MFDLESRPVTVNPFVRLLKRHLPRWFAAQKKVRRRNRTPLSHHVERLEDRSLLSANVPLDPTGVNWIPVGPSPILQGINPAREPVTGRVTGIAADPTDANTVYVATAGGGIWKTTNATNPNGPSWTPLTDHIPNLRDIFNNLVPDDQQTLVMGAVAVSKSNPNVVYAGTGIGGDLGWPGQFFSVNGVIEGPRDIGDKSFGKGILKSVDGGTSWILLPGNQANNDFDFRGISKIVVHPLNPNIVYVALGSSLDPNMPCSLNSVKPCGGYGVFKTTDGGVTWTNMTNSVAQQTSAYPISDSSDFTDLVMDPVDPETLYTAVSFSATSSGVYKTTNGGATWFRSSDFPAGDRNGLTKVAVSNTDRNVVYASISSAAFTGPSTDGNLGNLVAMMKSTNGGITWFTLTNTPDYFQNTQGGIRGFYNSVLAVDPSDPNIVYAGADRQFIESIDGGQTWTNIEAGSGALGGTGQAHHATAFDASGRLLDGNDEGIWRLKDKTLSSIDWDSMNGSGATGLQITLINSVATNRANDAILYAGTQNNDSAKFTDSLQWTTIPSAATTVPAGGIPVDVAHIVSDSSNPDTLFRDYNNNFNGQNVVERSFDGGNTWTQVGAGQILLTGARGEHQYYQPLAIASQGGAPRVYTATNQIFVASATPGSPNSIGNNWVQISWTADCGRSGVVFAPPTDVSEGWNTDSLVTALGPSSNPDIVWAATDSTHTGTFSSPPPCPGPTFSSGSLNNPGAFNNPGPHLFVSLFTRAAAGGSGPDTATVPNARNNAWINLTDTMRAALTASGAVLSGTAPSFFGSTSDPVVRSIKVDPQDPNTAYIAFTQITGGGQIFRVKFNPNTLTPTIEDITGDLPKLPIYDIEIDPRQFGLPDDILYVATQNGVYLTPNVPTVIPAGGLNWKKLGQGLPNAPVRDIELKKIRNLSNPNNPNDQTILVAGTYGRSVWEILANLPPTLTTVNTLGPVNEDNGSGTNKLTINYNTMFAQSDIADPNGDTVVFQLGQVTSGTLTKNGLPVVAGSTRLEPGDTWVWTPPPYQNNILNGNQPLNAFTVRAYDLELPSATPVQVRINVTPVPDAPVVQTNPIQFSVAKNSTANQFTYTQITNASGTFDPDEPPANVVTYIVETVPNGTLTKGGVPVIPGTTTLAAGETLEWTPVNGFQGLVTPAFTLRAQDNTSPTPLAATPDLRVNMNVVNSAPTLTSVGTLTGALEDTLFNIPFATLQSAANEADANGDPISFRIMAVSTGTLTLNGNAITPGVTLFAAGDTLNWLPAPNANGVLPAFTIQAWDGNLASGTDVQVTVNVQPVNDAPTLTNVTQFLTSRDFATTLTYQQLKSATDAADVDNTTASLNLVIGSAQNGSTLNVAPGTVLQPGQSIVWTPPAGFVGLINGFQIQAIDPGGLTSNPPVNVPFNVVVNNPPTLTTVNTLTGAQKNRPFTITYQAMINAADEADIDVPAQTLSFVVESVSSGNLTKNGVTVTPGVTTLGPGETLVYTPILGVQFPTPVEMFKTRVTDGFAVSASDVPVNVKIDNSAPTLSSVSTLTGAVEDTAFNISFPTLAGAANGADPDPFETVNYLISSVTNGTLLINGSPVIAGSTVFHNGDTLTWTPPLNANGTVAAFTVKAFDGTAINNPAGALSSATAVQVTISVTPVNDPPTLTTINPFIGGVQGISFDFTYSSLLAASDAADVDSTPILFRVEQVVSGSLTKNGAAVVPGTTTIGPNEKVTWTPPAGATGTLTAFTVRAFDGQLASAAPVSVTLDLSPLSISRMFRAYNPNADYHFFTLSALEFNAAVSHGYIDETTGRPGFSVATAQVNGTLAIHRLRNPNSGRHYYTANDVERNVLVSLGWIYEKDEGYIFTSQVTGSVEIFRLWNKNTGSHLYTENAAQKDAILAMFPGTWFQHASLGFAFPAPASGNPPSSPPQTARVRLASSLASVLAEASGANEESLAASVGPVFATASQGSTELARLMTVAPDTTAVPRYAAARRTDANNGSTDLGADRPAVGRSMRSDAHSTDEFWSDVGRQLEVGTSVGFDSDELRLGR